ncbi:MAG: ATP-grasp domain-containing protein, partial [Acidimicrobiia bacterium]
MDLLEYQGKQMFAQYGIPVSAGSPVTTVDEAVVAADAVGYPVVVKAQVLVGGRGTAGGVKLAENVDEVRTHASNILGMDI